MKTRRWFAEPLLTALLTLLLYLAWQIFYAFVTATSGTPIAEPYTSGADFVARMALGLLWVAVPLAAWAALAITGNRIVRRRGYSARALVAVVAAAILCVPVAIYFAVILTANDGWRGLGAISVAVPLIAPFLVLVAYWAASALLLLSDNKRGVETITSHR
jgi:ATP/ADP translocase